MCHVTVKAHLSQVITHFLESWLNWSIGFIEHPILCVCARVCSCIRLQGHNQLVAYSRAAYFCIFCALIWLLEQLLRRKDLPVSSLYGFTIVFHDALHCIRDLLVGTDYNTGLCQTGHFKMLCSLGVRWWLWLSFSCDALNRVYLLLPNHLLGGPFPSNQHLHNLPAGADWHTPFWRHRLGKLFLVLVLVVGF